MKIHNLILATCILLIIAGNIHSASFDCGKATTEVEKIICGDDELSKLDESLNKVYLEALKRTENKQQTIESQREWLKNVRNGCRTVACLRIAYETRIKGLGPSSSYGRHELLKRYPTGVGTAMFEVLPSDMEVCRAYEKNLNSFPEIRHPMVCERPINPAFKEFKTLRWTDLNVSEHRDTVRKMEKQLPIFREMKIDQWEEEFTRRTAEGMISLRSAKLEVNEIDGKPLGALLYMLEYGSTCKCNPMSRRFLDYSGGNKYFLTDQHMNNIEEIVGRGSWRDPFIYKNKAYFTSFSDTDWSDWFKHRLKSRQYEVWLYGLVRPVGQFAAVPMCRFRYIGKVPVIPSKEDQ